MITKVWIAITTPTCRQHQQVYAVAVADEIRISSSNLRQVQGIILKTTPAVLHIQADYIKREEFLTNELGLQDTRLWMKNIPEVIVM